MKHTNRLTNKCLCCGAKWTCPIGERDATARVHFDKCERAKRMIARWTGSDDGKMRSLINSYVSWREIMGVVKTTVKCDARCEGATRHICECSCGGMNHGSAVTA